MGADDDVSTGELYRSITELKTEIRELKNGFVPRGEYNEHNKAQGERIGTVEKAQAKMEAVMSAINQKAWGAVITGLLVPIVVAVLLVNLGLKP